MSLQMLLPILLCLLVLAPMLWVTARGKDAWPFSHYPMFSSLTDLSEVEVFRVALETATGEVVWWRSEFYRYPEFVGRKLKRIHQMECEGGRATAIASLERQRYLAEVLRLIDLEEGYLERYMAIRIVRRTVDPNGDNLTTNDDVVARIPFALIKRINLAD